MIRIAAAALLAAALPAAAAIEGDTRRLSSQYAAWAGGKSNADSIVQGLHRGTSIVIVTQGPGNTRSLAGFTPPAPMDPGQVVAALSRARSTLEAMGIRRPSADQIQAALIGGELSLGDGRTRLVQGSVVTTPDTLAAR